MIIGLVEFLVVSGLVLALALFELVPWYRYRRQQRERVFATKPPADT